MENRVDIKIFKQNGATLTLGRSLIHQLVIFASCKSIHHLSLLSNATKKRSIMGAKGSIQTAYYVMGKMGKTLRIFFFFILEISCLHITQNDDEISRFSPLEFNRPHLNTSKCFDIRYLMAVICEKKSTRKYLL